MVIFRAEYTDDSFKEFEIEHAGMMSDEEIWIAAYRLANGYKPETASIAALICIAM